MDSLGILEDAGWTSEIEREPGWEPRERQLPAPGSLLTHLIHNISQPQPKDAWGTSPKTVQKRKLLAARDAVTIAEALKLLNGPRRAREWEVLEGPSSPDVYLQTPRAIIVIEGKFTERTLTDYTTWLPGRHQMLRHIDAAWDQRGDRAVFGFFIVENADAPGWRDAVRRTLDPATITTSLPHRDRTTQAAIADAFLGLTTWRAVCEATGLRLPD